MTAPSPSPLARRLGLRDAVAIGLASMIGAGVFAVWAPAARAGGDWLLLGLALAALVAYANASSTGRLAARYPESGGAYRYGREELGVWPGFLAGWGFVIGKTASCAAMAMTAAAYLVPAEWQKPVAIAAVVLLSGLNLLGITRTARAATVIVAAVLAVLALVVLAGLSGLASGDAAGPLASEAATGPYGVLQSAGLLFFGFAGYARIATLGEEVRAPERTIPRAIAIALGVVVALYALLAVVLLQALGAGGLSAAGAAPLAELVGRSGWGWAVPVVGVGAGLAALGALLALIAGIGRTALAMARDGELPRGLAAVQSRTQVPYAAELVVATAIIAVLLVADLREAIGFSSFGVLLYYLVANLAALRLLGRSSGSPATRRARQGLAVVGALGCVVLVVTLPPLAVAGGVAVFALGALFRAIRLRLARPAP
ncbi:APC family permease [Agromyces mediolanus]|uniref:Transporter n=1 Tax=Agromyces mediolanus TaxID=41986 RepID=A0A918CAY7_AGRME|nr:APC family permease [Agromyces mediolanus]GGR16174.1 putative transporter [Agromyces mediolanus]GLJ73600.1 putative transporter [Agromyces mediolanus]